MAQRLPRVLLTRVSGSFEAHVLQARLASEGIDAELGASDSLYPFSVGAAAAVEVYVRDDQLEDARLVLLATEIDEAFEGRSHAPSPWQTRDVVLVTVVVALIVILTVVRSLRIL